MPRDFTTPDEVSAVYAKRAAYYDRFVDLYRLIGFREAVYREKAIAALALRCGDTVVDLGCGTGLNFAAIERTIGPQGKLVGVDLTAAMLGRARARVAANRWNNVELVHAAAGDFAFPERLGAVLSTYALTLEPRYDEVIARAARTLEPGRRMALADFKLPSGRARHLAPLLVFLTRPFAVSMALAERHPSESMERYFADTRMEEHYMGFVYTAVGEIVGA